MAAEIAAPKVPAVTIVVTLGVAAPAKAFIVAVPGVTVLPSRSIASIPVCKTETATKREASNPEAALI